MAKIPFSKLGLSKTSNTITTEVNGQTIEIKQYLPVQEKLDMISEILNKSVDPQRPYFYDMGRYTIMFDILLIKNYTNITFTEKQLEEPQKLYDLLWMNDEIASGILEAIPQSEIRQLHQWAQTTMSAITTHTQSALGILESMSQDYSNLNLDAEEIRKKIADPDNLKVLKDITPILGLK